MSILAFLIVVVVPLFAQAEHNGTKVHLDVYYESTCGCCQNFLVYQLKPTSMALTDYMETHLVPCGDGPRNKFHACALARMSEASNLDQVLMISCIMNPLNSPQTCCRKFGLKWSELVTCAKGPEGTALMDKYNKEAESVNPPFKYVPYITINKAEPNVDKIKLDVYYESQCPYCYEFFVNQLRPTSKALSEYMETNLVPYGNAKTIKKGDAVSFVCQHGESECLLTKIHVCALARVNNDNLQRVLLASCLFDYYKTPKQAGKKCSSKFGLEWSEVSACATGSEGTALMDKYGNETNSLNPPHPYVPYVAINKYRGNDTFQDLVDSKLETVVCNLLAKEKITPAACK